MTVRDYRQYRYSRDRAQRYFDYSLSAVWVLPLVLGIFVFGSSIWTTIQVGNDTDDWLDAAVLSPTAGDMDYRLSKTLEGMEKWDLVEGSGALFAENISDDYSRIYRDIASYRDEARSLASLDQNEHYQLQMANLREKVDLIGGSFAWNFYLDSWFNFAWVAIFAAIWPTVLLRDWIAKKIWNRRYNREAPTNGQTV